MGNVRERRYDYETNEKDSHLIRDRFLSPFYRKHAYEGRFIYMDGKRELKVEMNRDRKIDTFLQTEKGFITIDEKIDFPYDDGRERRNFALETEADSRIQKPSIMQVGEMDFLFYCFYHHTDTMTAYWIHMKTLRKWFWPRHDRFTTWINKAKNHERCSLVPIHLLTDPVRGVRGIRRYDLPEDL